MELQQQFEGDVQFIGVPEPNPDVDSSLSFVEGTGSAVLPHVHDPDGILWSDFGVTSRQTYIVIGQDGTVEDVEFDDLRAALEERHS